MRTKKVKAGLLTIVICLGLAGCGENAIPSLTDKDLQAIGEYTAFTLMKYDASNRSRLVPLFEDWESDVNQQEMPSVPDQQEPPEGGTAGDTSTADVSAQQGPASMEEMLKLSEGMSVSYLGAGLYDKYPDDEEIGGLAMTATEGRKLLVLSFQFANGTEQEQTVDIASQNVTFRINVNGDYKRNAMMALLLNDMSMFKETIPAGESKEAVLIIEVGQSSMEEISSIALSLKNDEDVYTIQLK